MTDERAEVPSRWLYAVLFLLLQMAGDGVEVAGCEDPAELLVEIAEHLGCAEADDPWEAALSEVRPAYRA